MKDEFQIQQALRAELDPGENIAWQAQPKARFFSGQGAAVFVFSLFWVGMLFFMFFMSQHGTHRTTTPPLFFAPFALVGLALLLAPVFQYFTLSRTYYLITDRRVLIVVLGRNKKVISYLPGKLGLLERRERSDGWGDIVIERQASNYNNRQGLREVGFMNIADVKRVDGMLRDLAARGGKA